MPRRKKLIKIRKPRLRITPKGKVKMSSPSVRVGGKTGVTVGKKGVGFSTRGKGWSFSTRRGLLFRGRKVSGDTSEKKSGCASLLPGCLIPMVTLALGIAVLILRP